MDDEQEKALRELRGEGPDQSIATVFRAQELHRRLVRQLRLYNEARLAEEPLPPSDIEGLAIMEQARMREAELQEREREARMTARRETATQFFANWRGSSLWSRLIHAVKGTLP